MKYWSTHWFTTWTFKYILIRTRSNHESIKMITSKFNDNFILEIWNLRKLYFYSKFSTQSWVAHYTVTNVSLLIFSNEYFCIWTFFYFSLVDWYCNYSSFHKRIHLSSRHIYRSSRSLICLLYAIGEYIFQTKKKTCSNNKN